MGKRPTIVRMGEAFKASEGVIVSNGFLNCNLYIIKNVPFTPGEQPEVLVCHAHFDQPVYPGYPQGISKKSAPTLERFLEKPGKKYAFSLFKPWQNIATVVEEGGKEDLTGGQDDHGIEQFLKEHDVRVLRSPLPYFLQTDAIEKDNQTSDQAFNIEYDVNDDRLRVFSNVSYDDLTKINQDFAEEYSQALRSKPYEREPKIANALARQSMKVYHGKNENADLLLDIHPFSDISRFKKQTDPARWTL